MTLNSTALSATAALFSVVLVACGATQDADESPESEYAKAQQEVQKIWVEFFTQDGPYYMNVLTTDTTTAVGGAFAAYRGPTGSCGVTFISKHYAVTAAHCLVDANNNLLSSFTVEQIDTSGLSIQAVLNASHVSGTWPNWTISTPLQNGVNGYNVTAMTCTPTYSCSTQYGGISTCPGMGGQNVDLALINCSTRASTKYIAVRTGAVSGKTEVWWFHEILDLQETPTAPTNNQPSGNWNHYGAHTYSTGGTGHSNNLTENYHYTTQTHKMIPLRSRHWPPAGSAPDYTIVAEDNPGKQTWTDVGGCHGTSGSGFLLNGGTELLGPALHNGDWGFAPTVDPLCANQNALFATKIGTQQTSFTQRQYTVQFQGLSIITNDR